MVESFWRPLSRFADIIGIWQGIVGLAVFWAALWAVMSWAVSTVRPIWSLGLGAVVVTGVVLACIIMLVVSIGLVSWRYFKPFPLPSGTTIWKGGETSTAQESCKRASELKTSRESLLVEAREMVLDILKRCKSDKDFREELEHHRTYYQLRPYLSEQYITTINRYNGWFVILPPNGATMPPLAKMLLEELDKLQKRWDLL